MTWVMTRLLPTMFLALTVLLPRAHAQTQTPCPGIASALSPSGYQALTVSTVAVGLPSPTGRMAVVVIESNSIRYRDDGTNPTASVGTLVSASSAPQTLVVCGHALGNFRAIRQGSADAAVSVNYYGG